MDRKIWKRNSDREKTVIFDTSCIILLDKIRELNLLKELYHKIYITTYISTEFGKNIPDWFVIKDPALKTFQKIFNLNLDRGEASAIALALETENSLLIIDDLKGRKVAESSELQFIGSLGIIEEAKNNKLISSIRPIMEKIKKTNFRISENLEKKIYENTGEDFY